MNSLPRKIGRSTGDLKSLHRSYQTRLAELRVENVQVEVAVPAAIPSATSVYAAALKVGKDVQETVESGGQINVRRLRRVTHAVIDEVMADQQSILALTTIKNFDEYLITHSTNVAILSVRWASIWG